MFLCCEVNDVFVFVYFFSLHLVLSLSQSLFSALVCMVATIACYSQSAIICSNHEFQDAVVRLLSLMKYVKKKVVYVISSDDVVISCLMQTVIISVF